LTATPSIVAVNAVGGRPVPLGGFWAFLAGGGALVVVLVWAHPIVDPARCPNAGAAGNASAFADPAWDVRLPVLMVGWLLLIAVEQTLPLTWRHRDRAAVALRAALALTVAVAAVCMVALPLETVCR
jgi:hypothetical protein